MTRDLVVSTRPAGAALVVSASGEVDILSAPKLSTALSEALATGSEVVVVDLSEVGFFGSAGLSVLVETLAAVTAQQLRVVASPQVQRPIELTGLDAMLDLYGTLPEALADGG
ncbi:STAS domain-containing protein [Nocardia sp. NPDC020380]|uniref:STAS domain-containing protein n=1 Tax=Nocardia sp. NPDC020380 TaxID=3364309 RepID=UPI0037AE9AF3